MIWTSYPWFVLLAQGYMSSENATIFVPPSSHYHDFTRLAPSFITSLGIGQFTRELSPEWGK